MRASAASALLFFCGPDLFPHLAHPFRPLFARFVVPFGAAVACNCAAIALDPSEFAFVRQKSDNFRGFVECSSRWATLRTNSGRNVKLTRPQQTNTATRGGATASHKYSRITPVVNNSIRLLRFVVFPQNYVLEL